VGSTRVSLNGSLLVRSVKVAPVKSVAPPKVTPWKVASPVKAAPPNAALCVKVVEEN
jgi:hypothetical protein